MEVFDKSFTQDLESRWSSRPPEEQPGLYFAATSPERADLRAWLDSVIATVPDPARDRVVHRLRSDRLFLATIHEVGVGSLLHQAGFALEHEPEVLGKTPDFIARHPDQPFPLVIDVWTREPAQSSLGARRAWATLIRRIGEISVSVLLTVTSVKGGRCQPPSSSEAKDAAADLHARLLRGHPTTGSVYDVGRFRFKVVGYSSGLGAVLAQPGEGGTVDTDLVEREIRRKLNRYRPVTEALDARSLVIVASDPRSPCSRAMVEATLQGTKTFSLSFSPWDEGQIGKTYSTRMNHENTPPSFGPECAGVGWFNLRLGDPELHLYPTIDGAGLPPALDGPSMTRHQFPTPQ
jgi:hypothetical protein